MSSTYFYAYIMRCYICCIRIVWIGIGSPVTRPPSRVTSAVWCAIWDARLFSSTLTILPNSVSLRQFYRCFRALLMCSATYKCSSYKCSSKGTKTLRTGRRIDHRNLAVLVTTPCQATAQNQKSEKPKSRCEPDESGPDSIKPVLSLVAYYNGWE